MGNIRHRRGFTLIEIIIAVIIVGILSSLVYPRYERTLERSRAAEALSMLDAMRKAQQGYRMEFGQYTLTPGDLDVDGTGLTYFNDPVIVGNIANPVIAIQRSTGDYTLTIIADGTMGCVDTGGGWCDALGY